MRVLVVNSGSSSLKLRMLDGDAVTGSHDVERWAGEDDTDELRAFLERAAPVDASGHRVVHGGTNLRGPVRVDDAVLEALVALTSLAPLHQPRALAGLRAVLRLRPDLPAVACFDTAFHATMPAAAATYALPAEWRTRWPLQRFGFHGLSHAYAIRRASEIAGRADEADLRVVSCHLGAGASLCAARGGVSIDTTMGFTPLEGLVMATRAGTVDPGLVLWLLEPGGLTAAAVTAGLEHDSGLKGLAGGDGDMRDILEARERGDEAATLAFDVYVHRLRRELGAMIAVLGGIDVLVFTGGVGEHAPAVRAAAVATLASSGVTVDRHGNGQASTDAEITGADAPVRTFVVTAREDLEIARQVRAVLAPTR